MKKRVLAAALAVVMAFGVTGCGKKDSTTADGKVKMVLWDGVEWEGETEATKAVHKYWQDAIAEKFPNLEIDLQSSQGGDYLANYDKALMAGTAPWAYAMFPYGNVPVRMENGTLADITDLYNDWEYKDLMLDYYDDAITKDGRRYAIVRSGYVMGTSYNKKTIESAGLDPNNLPKTWEEFAAAGQKITDKSIPRIGYELVGMDFAAWPFCAWVWSAGGEMVERDGDKWRLAFADDAGVDAAMFMNEMVWKYGMTQKDVLCSYADVMKDIKSGTAAFGWADISSLNNADLAVYGDMSLDDFGSMAMPVKDASIKNPGFTAGETIGFNPTISDEQLQIAWDYMTYVFYDDEYLTNLWEIQNEYQTGSIQMPARKDQYEKKLNTFTNVPQSIKDELLALTEIAKPEPYCPNWSEVKTALVKPLQTIMLDSDITWDEAEKLLDDCAKELCTQYPDVFSK